MLSGGWDNTIQIWDTRLKVRGMRIWSTTWPKR